ncbi:hypothetical protein RI054_06g32100 [Pseudoscourfieldia marina]
MDTVTCDFTSNDITRDRLIATAANLESESATKRMQVHCTMLFDALDDHHVRDINAFVTRLHPRTWHGIKPSSTYDKHGRAYANGRVATKLKLVARDLRESPRSIIGNKYGKCVRGRDDDAVRSGAQQARACADEAMASACADETMTPYVPVRNKPVRARTRRWQPHSRPFPRHSPAIFARVDRVDVTSVQTSCVGAASDAPNAYLRSKFDGEDAVRSEFDDASIVRLATFVGAEDRWRSFDLTTPTTTTTVVVVITRVQVVRLETPLLPSPET